MAEPQSGKRSSHGQVAEAATIGAPDAHIDPATLPALIRHIIQEPSHGLTGITAAALRFIDAASSGLIVLERATDDDGPNCRWIAVEGALARQTGRIEGARGSPWTACIARDQVVLVTDPGRRFASLTPLHGLLGQLLIAPVRGQDGRGIGCLWAGLPEDAPRLFTAADARILARLAEIAALALHMHEPAMPAARPMPLGDVSSPAPSREQPPALVVEPNAILRGCWRATVAQSLPDHAVEAMADLDEARVDRPVKLVLMVDWQGTEASAAALMQRCLTVQRLWPQAAIVLLSGAFDGQRVAELAGAGVRALIPLSLPFEVAVAALRLVAAGGTYFPSPDHAGGDGGTKSVRLENGGRAESTPAAVSALRDSLTGREAEVLTALVQGRSNKVIAKELGLSENTVKVHIAHIMRKLQAQNRTELALIAQRRFHLAPAHPGTPPAATT